MALKFHVLPLIIATQSFSYRKAKYSSRCDDTIIKISPIRIASTISSRHHPTTVFIHGLDSSKETWSGVINDLVSSGYPAIAIDIRGHGETDVGPVKDFSTRNIAQDILNYITHLNLEKPVVLVGHSMGGRIAIEALILELEAMKLGIPIRIASAVIEDIDVRARDGPIPSDEDLAAEKLKELETFSPEGRRRWPSWEALVSSYSQWYDLDRIESWKHKRVRELPSGEWWSDISPWVHRLSRKNILSTKDASLAWDQLAKSSPLSFPIHLWVAGRAGTVCSWDGPDGVLDMKRRLPAICVKEFPDAIHSIHNSDQKRFVHELKKIIDEAS